MEQSVVEALQSIAANISANNSGNFFESNAFTAIITISAVFLTAMTERWLHKKAWKDEKREREIVAALIPFCEFISKTSLLKGFQKDSSPYKQLVSLKEYLSPETTHEKRLAYSLSNAQSIYSLFTRVDQSIMEISDIASHIEKLLSVNFHQHMTRLNFDLRCKVKIDKNIVVGLLMEERMHMGNIAQGFHQDFGNGYGAVFTPGKYKATEEYVVTDIFDQAVHLYYSWVSDTMDDLSKISGLPEYLSSRKESLLQRLNELNSSVYSVYEDFNNQISLLTIK